MVGGGESIAARAARLGREPNPGPSEQEGDGGAGGHLRAHGVDPPGDRRLLGQGAQDHEFLSEQSARDGL
jgi:hypothetical protein